MPKVIDLTGKRFGKLVVLSLDGKIGRDKACLVLCDCGNKKRIPQTKLTRKNKPNRSCGCLMKENHFKTHGMTSDRLYPIWRSMMGRCYNKKNKSYGHYGERGIDVCCEWKEDPATFINWLNENGYEKGLEIDRVDNDKGYNPENCRIVTPSKNCRNRRNNITVEFQGEEVLLIDLAEKYNIKYGTLYARIKKGLPSEAAVGLTI